VIVVGLTGGPGAGKDEAMKIFKGFGAKIINADETGHNLLKKNTSVYKEIIKIFGSGILNSQNEIDRKRLGGIVFGNRKKLTLLNRAIHPLMEKEFRKEIASHRKRGTKFVVLNAAILFEAGWDKLVDRAILITAPIEVRVKRLEKSGTGREKALKMIFSQWADARKKKKADFIIENNGSLDSLKKRIIDVWKLIMKKGQVHFLR